MSHRVIWSLAFYALVAARKRTLGEFVPFFRTGTQLPRLAVASAFVAVNWLTYVWAVTHGHVMETSLGYFITPLLNVATGALILRERLSRAQWISLALATAGVLWLTFDYGRPPWIAMALAATFAVYGFQKKVLRGDPTIVSMAETTLLLPFAIVTAIVLRVYGPDMSGELLATPAVLSGAEWILLIGGGAVTGIPLLLFGVAAQRLPLSILGFFQYLAPTFQFLSAVFFFHEPLSHSRLFGFAFIWAALGVFLFDLTRRTR